MRFWVDAWDPSYAASASEDATAGPARESDAARDTDVEVPAAAWAAMSAPPDLRPPRTVLLVDGVRRQDATLWTAEADGSSFPALAFSYAAGVVRCDLRRGEASLAADPVVRRGLFTASPSATAVECGRRGQGGQVRYELHRVAGDDPAALSGAVQSPLTRLETEVAGAALAQVEMEVPDILMVLDGPLRGRADLRHTIGFVKTHQSRYLPSDLVAVVTGLAPGQRSPIFRLGTSWDCFTWYLRLPGGSGAPWSGIARAECPVHLPLESAVALADLSVVTLPRFAANPYKEPRAPQNLVPIAGLERRLRARLGDARLLHRALAGAATRVAAAAG
jgi:uncharacterized protein